MRKIEYGSDYSSEYEEVEESDYVTTDGENQDEESKQYVGGQSVEVLRELRRANSLIP